MNVDVVLVTKTCLSGNISDQKLLVTLLQLDLHFTTQKKVCVDCRDGRWGGGGLCKFAIPFLVS